MWEWVINQNVNKNSKISNRDLAKNALNVNWKITLITIMTKLHKSFNEKYKIKWTNENQMHFFNERNFYMDAIFDSN